LIGALLLERPRPSWRPLTGPHARKTVASLQFLYYYPTPEFWLQEFAMKTRKSECDLLLDQTLALVKAAIDHDAVSSRARLNPMLSNEIAAEKIARKEQDPLVEDILSLIEHVSTPKANGTAWEAERLKITDDISRMTSELNTLRSRVNDFKETQLRLNREREETLRPWQKPAEHSGIRPSHETYENRFQNAKPNLTLKPRLGAGLKCLCD
jgi:hypothetical protein